MLAKDLPRFFREVTRESGTKLFLYWSGLEDGVAAGRHPDWCLLGSDGKPTRFFSNILPANVPAAGMCPQSPFFDEWVSVQLREVFAISDPDGMWVDGTWMPPCYCPRCVGRYRKETGFKGEIPSGVDRNGRAGGEVPEDVVAWNRYWAKVLYEYRTRFLKLVKSLKPAFLCSFGNITVRKEFREDRDWCSGDWYSPDNHRLQQSIAMRRYTTTGLAYEAWLCDTQMLHALTNFRARTKSLSRMLQEGAGLLANGGQWTYWTFPMPNGALVPSRMRQAKKAAEFARQRADVFLHNQSARWTTILDMEPKNTWWSDSLWGAGKALVQLHRSPDLMEESNLRDDMPYDLVVVPEQPVITPQTVAKLEAFVRRGGKLLSTGVSIMPPEMQKLLGVQLIQRGAADDGHVFLKSGDSAGVYAPWDKLELREATELYPLYLSWDETNPWMKAFPANWAITGLVDEENPEKAGFPAATVRKLGKGMAMHIPTDFFMTYWKFGNLDMLAWMREIFDYLQPEPLFRTDAFSYVEVVLRQKRDTLLVHLVNGSAGRDLSHVHTEDLWVDEIPPLGPITCWLRCAGRPGKVTWEPGGIPAHETWLNGELKAVLPRLDIHTCMKVEGWQRIG
jgi:hypothetical protein